MSEVNQAFLKAYLKNRTQSVPTNSGASAESNTHASPLQTLPPRGFSEARPAQAVPSQMRPRSPQAEPLFRHADQGRNLRVDPSHASEPIEKHVDSGLMPNVARPSTASTPVARTLPTQSPPDKPQPPRQGVWSPLGAERGMKAMESMSVPAVVNNAVPSVPLEATRQRKEMPASKSSSPSVNVSAPATNSNNHNAPTTPSRTTLGTQKPTANIHYDQVMFVDGLGDTAVAPHVQSRAQRATLEEISQPIEVGTGATLPQPPSKRTGGLPLHPLQPASNVQTSPMATPASHETTTSNDSVGVRGREAFVSRRFDAPHVQPVTSTEPIVSRQVSPVSAPNTPVAPKFAPETPEQGRGAMKMPADLPSARHESFAATPQKNKVGSESFAASDSMAAKATTALPLPVAFTPSWEVDRFFWPEVVKQIEKSHADAFAQIGKHLSLANRDGLRVMAITSGERGVGRSTVAMHMARCAAASGLKVALVDGDTYCPSLIDQLRLDMQHGWQDCLFENVPLSEVAVHALADGITLFPLTSVVPPQQMHANLHRMAKMIKRISTAFDMVFIDASRLNLEQRDLVGVAQESIVDAAIVVVDTELSIKEKVDSAVSILQGMGISSIGLVENFQS